MRGRLSPEWKLVERGGGSTGQVVCTKTAAIDVVKVVETYGILSYITAPEIKHTIHNARADNPEMLVVLTARRLKKSTVVCTSL